MGERENRIKGTVGKLTSAKGLECLFIVTRKQCCPHELGYRYLDRYDWSSWNFFSDFLYFFKKEKKKLPADKEERTICCKYEEKVENKKKKCDNQPRK